MRLKIAITIFAVTGTLVVIAKPVPKWDAGGIAIPLARHSSSPTDKSIDLDVVASHGISVREKILSGLDNYEMNMGMVHPFAVKRNESGLEKRGASLPLTNHQYQFWAGEISIGTPPKTLNLKIDTGATDMWVLQTGSAGVSGDRDLWDPHSSKNAENQDQPFELSYGDGTIVKGDLYTDNVTIAGFTAEPQIFGSATQYISYDNACPADGFLGLAFPSISAFKFGASPLFESLVRQGKVIHPTFSLKLDSSGAEMYVGGANSMLYNGDIAYTSVTYPAYWQVYMDEVRVNGKKILENVPAIFDTGASYIFGDQERVSELYRGLGGTLEEYRGFGFYYLPCDSFPTVSLTFGGRAFEIPPEVLRIAPIRESSPNCLSAIVAEHSHTITFWTIGIPFLQGVYSVFDYTTLQVGFAALA